MSNIEKQFKEWEILIEKLNKQEKKYDKLNNEYKNKYVEIMMETDFKTIYGQNNDKVRDYHINEIIKDLFTEKENLRIDIDNNKRKLDLLKCIMNYQTKKE